jgi:hypothetical protein
MQYDFTLVAGGGQPIDVKGRFFKYKSGSGLIRVSTDKGGFVDLLPGQGIRNTEFSRLVVSDRTGSGGYGVLIAGDFDFQDDRISGTVDVVDGGKSRTLANMAFMGVPTIGALAGNYSHAQIWNPAGSGKNAILKRYTVSSSSACFILVKFHTAALASLIAKGKSKNAAGPVSVAEVRSSQDVVLLANQVIDQFFVSAGGSQTIALSEPIVIPPGYGVVFVPAMTAADIAAGLEWFEEPL